MSTLTPLHPLFAAVYDAPGELVRRQVLADALIEGGDPRGEFIALQFDTSARSRKRAQKLLVRHRKAWLGRLADVFVSGTDVWRHGFVVSAHARLAGTTADEPSWATVEALVLFPSIGVAHELASPWLKSLRSVELCALRLDGRYAWQTSQTWAEQQQELRHVRSMLLEGKRPRVLREGREWHRG